MSGFGSSAKLTQTQCDKIKEELKDDVREMITDELAQKVGALDDKVTGLENRVDKIDDMALHKPSGWGDVAAFVKKGYAPLAFSTGEQLVTPWTYNGTTYQVGQNICHFSDSAEFSNDNGKNVTTGKGMVLQWHYTTPFSMIFDEREAIYVTPESGLAAGTYYFTVAGISKYYGYASANNGKTFMFTLTDKLAQGQMLVLSATMDTSDFGGTYIRVYDSPYDTAYNTAYGTSGDMVLSEWDNASGLPLSGDTSANSTDGKGELNRIHSALDGYGSWSQSAIRQWLNSSSPARDANDTENYPGWWKPQNKFDRIPAQAFTYPGFLAGYEEDFIAAMKPVKVITGSTNITYDKVFLPSLTQMNIESNSVEGEVWDYYKKLFANNPIEGGTNFPLSRVIGSLVSRSISTQKAVDVRLRTSFATDPRIYYITSYGNITYTGAISLCHCCPACVIG